MLAEAYYYLGRLRAQMSDPTAREAFQRYLDVDPKGAYATEVRQMLKDGTTGTVAPPPPTPTNSRLQKRRRGR